MIIFNGGHFMFKKPSKKEDIESFMKEANDAEIDLLLQLKKENKLHRIASTGFFLLSALSIGAVAGLTPLKERVPYLLVADKSTGTVDSLSVLTPDEVMSNEAVLEYFIRLYVSRRESYNYNLIQINYDQTLAMSDDAVAAAYDSLFGKKDSIDTRYQGNLEITVDVPTVILDVKNQKAVVRFSKTFKEANKEPITQYWSADVSYHYSQNTQRNGQRAQNPLGMLVDGYRSSQEVSR